MTPLATMPGFLLQLPVIVFHSRAAGNSRFEGDKFPVLLWKKSRKFPLRINDLFTSKHVHYCQKVGEIDLFFSTAQNSIVIAFKFTFVVTFIAGTPRIPVLEVTHFRSAL